MSHSAEDLEYMRRALSLAARGAGHVSPNPLVGAVIVRDGRVIGEGWHAMFGGPHAERNALANCTESPRGATIYVTLEPCRAPTRSSNRDLRAWSSARPTPTRWLLERACRYCANTALKWWKTS